MSGEMRHAMRQSVRKSSGQPWHLGWQCWRPTGATERDQRAQCLLSWTALTGNLLAVLWLSVSELHSLDYKRLPGHAPGVNTHTLRHKWMQTMHHLPVSALFLWPLGSGDTCLHIHLVIRSNLLETNSRSGPSYCDRRSWTFVKLQRNRLTLACV